jgi:hypothetical protein
MEVSGQIHAPAALPQWKNAWYLLDRRLPRAVLDTVVKRKIPSPRRKSNPRTQNVQPVAQRYTDWTIAALLVLVISKSTRTDPSSFVKDSDHNAEISFMWRR